MEQTTINEEVVVETTKPKKKKRITKKGLIIKKYIFIVLEYVGLFLPMFIFAMVNFHKYFATNKDSFSVASGGIIIAIFTVLLAKIGIKKLHKAISASFVLAIVWCLNSIIADMLPITLMFWIGILVYSILEIPTNHYKKLVDTWVDEEVRMNVRKEHRGKQEGETDEYGEI